MQLFNIYLTFLLFIYTKIIKNAFFLVFWDLLRIRARSLHWLQVKC